MISSKSKNLLQHYCSEESILWCSAFFIVQLSHPYISRPLLLLPSVFPSIRVFSNESVHCIRWPKFWSFSFSICPSNEYSELISFRIDWFDLLAVRGILPAPQFESISSSVLCFPEVFLIFWICSVQSLRRVLLFATPWTAAHQASLSITNFWSILKLISIAISDAIQPSHPLLSPSPPAFNLSQHQGLF